VEFAVLLDREVRATERAGATVAPKRRGQLASMTGYPEYSPRPCHVSRTVRHEPLIVAILGALAVSLALPWALRGTFPHLHGWELIVIGAVVGIGGQLGDLAIGVIKLDLGIQGMGAAIPGHGGILDRIDSLIYVAPLFLHIVQHSHDLYWNAA
jgi:phosphatidate cytidylyltransferase